MIRAGLLALLLLTQPAHALSCLRPDVVRSYQDRMGQEALVVLLGSFNFAPEALRQTDTTMTQPPTERSVVARFRGEDVLTATRIESDLTVIGRCYGPWCGAMAPGTHLAFATRDAEGLELAVDPCGTATFADPDLLTLARLERCMRDGICEVAE